MKWKTIFNPFVKFSEQQLIIFGMVFFILNGLVLYFGNMKMDSIFHFSPVENANLAITFFYCAFSIIFAVVVLFILGKIFNSKTRLIDILNAVLISQALNFVVIITSQLIDLSKLASKSPQNSPLEISDLFMVLLFAGLTLPFIIYSIALLYNGFRTATNIKSWQKISIFAIVLFISLPACQFITSIIKL